MIIDLCSGIGRWPVEDVIRIDIDPKTKPTIIADIRYLPLRPKLRPRLCHASPPCTYTCGPRRWRYGWNPKGIAESLRLIAACYDAFAYLEAETCTLEQPQGFEDLLKRKIQFKYNKADMRNVTSNFYVNKKSMMRAIIPMSVKSKLLEFTEP